MKIKKALIIQASALILKNGKGDISEDNKLKKKIKMKNQINTLGIFKLAAPILLRFDNQIKKSGKKKISNNVTVKPFADT